VVRTAPVCSVTSYFPSVPNSILTATTIVLTVVYFCTAMRSSQRFVYCSRSAAGNSADGLNPDQPTSDNDSEWEDTSSNDSEWEDISSNESSPSLHTEIMAGVMGKHATKHTEMMAGVMSIYATRRIHANQKPAGIFLCGVCKGLDFRRGMPRDAEVVYLMSIASMSSSASRGCRSCQFLSDCLTQIKNVYGEGLWGNRPMMILHSMALGGPLQLLPYAGDPTSTSSMRIEIYVKEGKHDSTLIPSH